MKQTTIESNQSDESIVSKISEQVKDTPTRVAEEISNITGATATVINARTIQIDNNGIISSVRIRDSKKGSSCISKITHGGSWDDVGAKIVGDVFSNGNINIRSSTIKAIVSSSSSWDIVNISTVKADEFNTKRVHPSIGWATPHNENGKIGVSIDIRTPNAESWEAQKIDNKTKHTIPSGKTVFKIISESDADFDVSNNGVRVKGTIEQVNKVIDRITGNPLSDW